MGVELATQVVFFIAQVRGRVPGSQKHATNSDVIPTEDHPSQGGGSRTLPVILGNKSPLAITKFFILTSILALGTGVVSALPQPQSAELEACTMSCFPEAPKYGSNSVTSLLTQIPRNSYQRVEEAVTRANQSRKIVS